MGLVILVWLEFTLNKLLLLVSQVLEKNALALVTVAPVEVNVNVEHHLVWVADGHELHVNVFLLFFELLNFLVMYGLATLLGVGVSSSFIEANGALASASFGLNFLVVEFVVV